MVSKARNSKGSVTSMLDFSRSWKKEERREGGRNNLASWSFKFGELNMF